MNNSSDQIPISDKEFEDSLKALSIKAKRNAKILIFLFITGFSIMFYIIHSLPNLKPEEKANILQFPRNAEDMKRFVVAVLNYSENYSYHVFALFIWIYLFLQSFAIPGPLILSILAGALYGKIWGLVVVSIVASLGASGCYFISHTLAKYWVYKYFPKRVLSFKKSIDDNRENLFFYILFLRITPLIPNWLLNLSTPIVGVPYKYFFFATFLGLIPANIMHVTMGSEISKLERLGFDYKIILMLLLIGFLALIPVWVKRAFKGKFKSE